VSAGAAVGHNVNVWWRAAVPGELGEGEETVKRGQEAALAGGEHSSAKHHTAGAEHLEEVHVWHLPLVLLFARHSRLAAVKRTSRRKTNKQEMKREQGEREFDRVQHLYQAIHIVA
jgi:hypothetical protein